MITTCSLSEISGMNEEGESLWLAVIKAETASLRRVDELK